MLVHTTCRVWRNCFNDERWLRASTDGSSLIFLPQSYSFPLVNFYMVGNQTIWETVPCLLVHLLSKGLENSLWLWKSHLVWSGQVWLWYCSCSIYCSKIPSACQEGKHLRKTPPDTHISFGHTPQISRQRIPGDIQEFSVQPWLTNDYTCNSCKPRQ